ncbi:type IV secretory system conjugative DNA transfer family protein [Listeria innocua]|uniref:type IV secretory system conjugative DNA transfer family protein n=1 Tax=Listeria innocua TaxID=1642 RepID=UPI0016231DEA|nr:type IV secretory system conjugative DNA transfer family protein [Listeria innocua]
MKSYLKELWEDLFFSWRDPQARAFQRLERFLGLEKYFWFFVLVECSGAVFLVNLLCSVPNMIKSMFPMGLLGGNVDYMRLFQLKWLLTFPPFSWWVVLVFILLCGILILSSYRFMMNNIALEDLHTQGLNRWVFDRELKVEHPTMATDDEQYTGETGIVIGTAKRTSLDYKLKRVREYLATESTHFLLFGMTGIGKGIFGVDKAIDSLSRPMALAKKASLLIHDPSGELFKKYGNLLKKRQYIVKLLNLADPFISDTFNPLSFLAERYKVYLFETDAIERERALSDASGEIESLVYSWFDDPQAKEKIWQQSAGSLTGAVALAIVEESLLLGKPDLISMYTVITTIESMGSVRMTYESHPYLLKLVVHIQDDDKREKRLKQLFTMYKDKSMLDVYFSELPSGHPAKGKYEAILASAPAQATIGNVMTHTINNLEAFKRPGNARITSSDTIHILDIGLHKQPVAVFLLVSDQDKSNHPLASNFIDQTFKRLASHALRYCPDNKLPRKVFIIGEEFGNMPAIPDIGTKVTDSRKFNLFWYFVLQSLGQLDKYPEADRKSIIGNCGYVLYERSASSETNEQIMKWLGNRGVLNQSRQKKVLGQESTLTESVDKIPMLPENQLVQLRFGEMVVLRFLKTHDLKGNSSKTFYPIFACGKSRMKPSYEYLNPETLSMTEVKSWYQDAPHLSTDLAEKLYQLDVEEIYWKEKRKTATRAGQHFNRPVFKAVTPLSDEKKQAIQALSLQTPEKVALASSELPSKEKKAQGTANEAKEENRYLENFQHFMRQSFSQTNEQLSVISVLGEDNYQRLLPLIRQYSEDKARLKSEYKLVERQSFSSWLNWICEVGRERCVAEIMRVIQYEKEKGVNR